MNSVIKNAISKGEQIMRYAIISSKKTGNTWELTKAVHKALQGFSTGECVFYGCVEDLTPEALTADRLYLGFWTDQGMCDSYIKELLSKVKDKEIFLFGSAGFGIDKAYFDEVLGKSKEFMDTSNKLIGEFMCQGRMKPVVRQKYEDMLKAAKENNDEKAIKTAEMLIDNFDMALAHPNDEDFKNLADTVVKKFY